MGGQGGGYILSSSGRGELGRGRVRLEVCGVGFLCPMICTGEKEGASGEKVGVVVVVVGGGVVHVVVGKAGGEAVVAQDFSWVGGLGIQSRMGENDGESAERAGGLGVGVLGWEGLVVVEGVVRVVVLFERRRPRPYRIHILVWVRSSEQGRILESPR